MNCQKSIKKKENEHHSLYFLKKMSKIFKKDIDKPCKNVYTMYIRDTKEGRNMITTVQKWGNSHGIRLPKHLLDKAQIKPNDKISVDLSDGDIVIRKITDKPTITKLFEGYNENYVSTEIDWGNPVGNEIW